MRRLPLILAILLVFTNLTFAQKKERKSESAKKVKAQITYSYITSDTKILFLGLQNDTYLVVELLVCSPTISVNSRINGPSLVHGKANYQHYGTINQGPFYLADETLCKIEIIVKNRKQKLDWEAKINEALSMVPEIKK